MHTLGFGHFVDWERPAFAWSGVSVVSVNSGHVSLLNGSQMIPKQLLFFFTSFKQHRFPQLLLAWSEFSIRSVTTLNKIMVDCILARLLCYPGWSMKGVWPTKYLHFVSFWFFLILLPEILWHALTQSFFFLTTSEGNIKSVYYLHIYHPPTELWEGNVFSCMCLSSGLSPRANVSMWPLPMMPWTSLYGASSSQTSDLGPTCPQFLDIRPGNPSSPSLCCYWHLVAIIGDLFKHVRLRKSLPRVTSGYGHWRTHSFQVGGTHPTGMHSCLECFRS